MNNLWGREYTELIEPVKEGRDLKTLPADHPARRDKEMLDRISLSNTGTEEVVMLDGARTIIPEKAVGSIVNDLLREHSGTEKMMKTATASSISLLPACASVHRASSMVKWYTSIRGTLVCPTARLSKFRKSRVAKIPNPFIQRLQFVQQKWQKL